MFNYMKTIIKKYQLQNKRKERKLMENKLIAHSLIMFKNKYLVIKRSDIKRGEKIIIPLIGIFQVGV